MSGKTTITLGNAVDIAHAAKLKERLKTSLAKNKTVVIVADKVEKTDTAGLQLLLAFVKAVESKGHTVTWQKPSEALTQVSESLGLSNALKLL